MTISKSSQAATAAILAILTPASATAGHLFTQASSNTPTWIQAGQGIAIDQYGDEGGSGDGRITVNFEAPSGAAPGTITQTANPNDWWNWSAGDVIKINLPLDDATYTYTIAYDAASGVCAYDYCGVTTGDLSVTTAGTANDLSSANVGLTLPAHSGQSPSYTDSDVSFNWSIVSIAGEFALGGYRLYTGAGTINGTGAGPLDQSSVVDADVAEGGGDPRPINGDSDGVGDLGSTTTYQFDGGTLVTDADLSASFTITDNGGTMEVAGGSTQTMSGALSDDTGASGEFTKEGAGTLVLTGTNTHTGGTTIEGGTVQVATDESLGAASGGVTLDGGALATTDDLETARAITLGGGNGEVAPSDGTRLALTGTVAGAGRLDMSGEGTVVLSGENTYSGGTMVEGGTVQVATDESLGAASGGVTLDGGALATTADLTSERRLTVGSEGAELVASADTMLTLNGEIDGTGTLELTGAGTVVMADSGTTSRDVIVTLGELAVRGDLSARRAIVRADGTLTGNGTVNADVTSAGRISAGNSPGTLTIDGDVTLTGTSVLDAEIDGRNYKSTGGAGSYDRIIVTGEDNVFTAGGTVAPILRGIVGDADNTFTPSIGDKFRIVVTENNSGIAGAFADIDNPSEGIPDHTRFDVIYGDNTIDLVLTPESFSTIALDYGLTNVEGFASALDDLRPDFGTNGSDDINTLMNGLYGLSGDGLAIAMLQLSGQVHAVALADLQDATQHAAGSLINQSRFAASQGQNFWIDSSGYSLSFDGDDHASATDNAGVSFWFGTDLHQTETMTMGVGLGQIDATVDSGLYGNAETTTLAFAVYGYGTSGNLNYQGAIVRGQADMTGSRTTALATGNVANTFSTSAMVTSVNARAGYTIDMSDSVELTPWIGGEMTITAADGYSESGSSVTALTVSSQSQKSTRASAGFELAGTYSDNVSWTLGAGASRAFGAEDSYVSRDISLHGAEWSVSEQQTDGLTKFVSVGISTALNDGWSLRTQLGLSSANGQSGHTASVGVGFAW